MVLTITLTPSEEARLNDMAGRDGIEPADLARKLVTDQLPPAASNAQDNLAAINLLQSWLQADGPTEPEQIMEAERELQEFKRNLNANREATGERVLFPE
ncbi:MAG: hypothetical protein JWQ02_1606 [Capsulimonas sp.]|jgi:hypothetical protein|nr:hypothetical protein [Capsulimonas sp.]